jgi:peptidoglycan hydrolase-like protein with peptidoglycan-binding domain
MRAILSILKGQSLADWYAENAREVVFEVFDGELPQVWRLDEDPILKEPANVYVKRIQRLVDVSPVDGVYGPMTVAAVKSRAGNSEYTGTTVDTFVWTNLIGMWGARQVSSRSVPGRKRNPITLHRFENAKLPVLKYGDSDDAGGVDGSGAQYVRRLQRGLGVTVDGDYGPETANAIKGWGFGDGKVANLAVYRAIHGILNVEPDGTIKVKRK